MFTRAAKRMTKVLSYPSDLAAAIGMVAMVFVMVVVAANVFSRWIFNSPLRGTSDLTTLAFVFIVWGPMAMAAFKGAHIALTTVLDRLPRLPRLVMDLIIAVVSGGMLGMVSWRLVVYGIGQGKVISQTGVLKAPWEPFVYFAAGAVALMALVFLARVPEAAGKIRKEPEATERIQKER
jgi:TRAP-type C4-dicarboxylate transport system permease small subunit